MIFKWIFWNFQFRNVCKENWIFPQENRWMSGYTDSISQYINRCTILHGYKPRSCRLLSRATAGTWENLLGLSFTSKNSRRQHCAAICPKLKYHVNFLLNYELRCEILIVYWCFRHPSILFYWSFVVFNIQCIFPTFSSKFLDFSEMLEGPLTESSLLNL